MANTGHEKPRRIGVFDLGSNTILLLVMDADGQRGARRVPDHAARAGCVRARRARVRGDRAHARPRSPSSRRAGAGGRRRAAGRGRHRGAAPRARRRRVPRAGWCGAGTVDGARLLSGDEEAELTLEATRLGVGERAGRDRGDRRGGGSTEVAWRATRWRSDSGVSLPLGSVRLTEAHLPRHPIPAADLAALRARVDAGRRAARPRAPGRSPRGRRGGRGRRHARPRSRRSSSRSIPTIRRGSKGSSSTSIGSRTGSSGSPRWASRRASAFPGSSPAART